MKNLYAVILAGGSGTRLWPISRAYYPKQFLKIIGDETLIQRTFTRLKKIIPPENIYITTNRIFVDEIINQIEEFGFNKNNIIIQPADKNTEPAIAQASKRIFDEDNSAVIVICPSDHLIQSESNFSSCLQKAYKLAQKDLLITFGIKPKEANPEYGYILPKKSDTSTSSPSFKVERFVVKPTVKLAKKLIKGGSFWNSGIFIWKVRVILSEIDKFNKDLSQACRSNKKYFSLDSISIDKGILEKSDLVWVIPATFDWRDIGSWKALYELLPKDSNKNVTNNRVVAYNCNDSLIYGTDNRFVTAINLKDIIVVDTKDYVLIAPRENTHEIKNVFQQIKTVGLEENLQRPLVTIITPSYNNDTSIENTIKSVLDQNYKNIEYILIDGGSNYKTPSIIKKYKYRIEQFMSMPNTNIFEKMNKGIELANGEIIGILKPGDSYIDNKVLEEIVTNMETNKTYISWGDLIYYNSSNTDKISMHWKSSPYKKGLLQKGWIPPHATFFVRRSVYQKYGSFNTKFSVAAEYELMLRLLEKYKVPSNHIPRILVKMVGEGMSLKNIADRFKGNFESYRSWKENGLEISPLILFSKNIFKVSQLWQKTDNNVI